MTNPHYVPYVNNCDLLEKALVSLESIRDDVVVVDNRDVFTQQPEPPTDWCILKPQFTLNQAQLLTWLAMRTQTMGFDWFTWSHNDGLSVESTIDKLRALAQRLTGDGRQWGIIFTRFRESPEAWNHVDVFSAINVKAVLSVGGWDWVRWPDVFSDYDMYSKLQRAGFETIQSELPIVHLNGGSKTVAVDGNRALVKATYWPAYQALWEARKKELGTTWPPE